MGHWEAVDRALTRLLQRALDEEMTRVPRVFVADEHGATATLSHDEFYRHAGVSPAASAAFDVLNNDGVPAKKAWELALAMDKNPSHRGDAEAQARHFVELRRSMR